jgi:hypothetical protein
MIEQRVMEETFSVRSAPGLYNEEQYLNCCWVGWENWEAGSWGRGEFGNLEEGERPQLETATKQQLVKTEKILCML